MLAAQCLFAGQNDSCLFTVGLVFTAQALILSELPKVSLSPLFLPAAPRKLLGELFLNAPTNLMLQHTSSPIPQVSICPTQFQFFFIL